VTELWEWSATEIVDQVKARRVSVTEVVKASVERIEATNPTVNAIVTFIPDEALAAAALADGRLQAGEAVRPLEGVPFTVKDVIPTKGVRSTYGSLIFANLVPDEDAISVERFKANGAILVGKSNTPEFAHDPFCNTQNAIFGTTRNPWDVNRTAGGSSGGAAAGIAAGMTPVGLGTDWGGSARGPSSFCGTIGMRPSPGRVPVYPHETRSGFAWDFPVEHAHAPMTRVVADIGLALNALAGPDDRAPASLPREAHDYADAASGRANLKGRRVAYSRDFNGVLPVDKQVADLTERAALRFQDLGCTVEEASPDFSELIATVAATRAVGLVLRYADYLREHREKISAPLIRQIEAALSSDLLTTARGEKMRTKLWHQVRHFWADYDYLLSPTWGVAAFRIDVPFDSMINGVKLPSFFDCIQFTYAMSLLGLPAVTVPCGRNSEGMPVGLQIAGHRLGEVSIFEAAAAYEGLRGPYDRPPDLASQTPGTLSPFFQSDNGWAPVSTDLRKAEVIGSGS
jgi:amidase